MKKIILSGMVVVSLTLATSLIYSRGSNLALSSEEKDYAQDTTKRYTDTAKYKMKKWKDSTSKKWMKDSLKRKQIDTIRKDLDTSLRKP